MDRRLLRLRLGPILIAFELNARAVGGYEAEARKVVLNQITMAMVSDCLHHIYEALRCLEKRKVIVALNLLRKPLTDNLLYLSWMLGDEDGFYHAFTTNSPRGITLSILKSKRAEILSSALAMTEVADVLNAEFIDRALFTQANPSGFQKLFQHAVHLVTVQRVELETTPENFNFIFKRYDDDDLYELVYEVLPHVLLYLSHVIFGLFERMAAPDDGGKNAFHVRSILGLYLVEGEENEAQPSGGDMSERPLLGSVWQTANGKEGNAELPSASDMRETYCLARTICTFPASAMIRLAKTDT